MKLRGSTIVMIPWFDAENQKQYVSMRFNGEIDRKFLYKQVVKYVKREFQKTVDRIWIQQQCLLINEFDKNAGGKAFDSVGFQNALDQWIHDMEVEADALEAESDTTLPPADNAGAEVPVSNLPSVD